MIPKYNNDEPCPKCGALHWLLKFQLVSYQCSELLQCKCFRCGFEMTRLPLDATPREIRKAEKTCQYAVSLSSEG